MTQIYNFQGQYIRKGSTFTSSNGITLAIASRKNFTPSKPKEFVIYRTQENPKGQFFSSIYPQLDGTHHADHEGKEYRLTFTNEGLKIEAA